MHLRPAAEAAVLIWTDKIRVETITDTDVIVDCDLQARGPTSLCVGESVSMTVVPLLPKSSPTHFLA